MSFLLMVQFLRLWVDPTSSRINPIIVETPQTTFCAQAGAPEWGTYQGTLVPLAHDRVRLIPDGPGDYEVWAHIPDTTCDGRILITIPSLNEEER